VHQPSYFSPELAKCGADLATSRDDLARRRDDLTARRDDGAALMNAAWRDVEVTVPSAEASRQHCGGDRAAPSTRAGRMPQATWPPAHSTVPFVEQTAPRVEAACTRAERIAPHASSIVRAGEMTLPRAETSVPAPRVICRADERTGRLWQSDLPECRADHSRRRDDWNRRSGNASKVRRRVGENIETASPRAQLTGLYAQLTDRRVRTNRRACRGHRTTWSIQLSSPPSAPCRTAHSTALAAEFTARGDEITLLNAEVIPTNSDPTATNWR
jgi:hypothetical protein